MTSSTHRIGRTCLTLGVLSAAAASVVGPARGADKTWDNGSTNSIWDTSSANWSSAAWDNGAGDGAIFGVTGAGAISVNGPIKVDSVNFTAPGYTLNGTGAITFVDGTSTWTSGVINTDTGISAAINVPLHSAVGFQKIGAGTLLLTSTN